MSVYEERAKDLGKWIHSVTASIESIDDRSPYDAPALARLEASLAYADLALSRTDPQLISQSAYSGLKDGLELMDEDVVWTATNADDNADTILDALQRLPVAAGRDLEQEVLAAATKFRRSAAQRLRSVKSEIDAQRARLAALESEINDADAAATSDLGELRAAITAEKTRLDALANLQSETFAAAQEERAEAFGEILDPIESDAKELAGTFIAEIQRMERETRDLVGAIGLAGTAERYGEEVIEQRASANQWRWFTVGFAVFAVLVAGYWARHPERTAEGVAGKAALTAILAGLAAYAARQSAYHRHREANARALQLELAAFAPFIEPLIREQQEEERVIMTRKTFGKSTLRVKADEEPGPTPLSFLLRRRVGQELEAGSPLESVEE